MGRSAPFVLPVVLVAVFGPYLAGGVRTEQVVVYLAALVFVPLWWRPVQPALTITAAWVGYMAVVGIATLVAPAPPELPRSVLAGLDNVALPLAVLLLATAVTLRVGNRERLLRTCAATTAVMMSLNAVAAALTIFLGVRWSMFWSSTPGVSTADRALGNGRASGLVNQPAEAGVMYGIAALCAIYLWRAEPRKLLPVLTVLGAGGLMTVSKGFLLLAAPIIVWHFLYGREGRAARLKAAGVAVGVVLVVLGAMLVGLLPKWRGVDQIGRLISAEGGLLNRVTANRFGDDATLGEVVSVVMGGSPVIGYGAGGLQLPYDNAWVEALVMGGVVGAVLFTVVLGLLWWVWWGQPRGYERTLFGGLLLLATLAGVGVPAFTANRVSVVLWVLSAVLMVEGWRTHETPSRSDPEAVREGV